MTRRLLFCAVLVVVGYSLVAMASEADVRNAKAKYGPMGVSRATSAPISHDRASTLDEVIYAETWESGTLDGWISHDNVPPSLAEWHLDTYNAFGSTGTSWWMADTIAHYNGYHNRQYQVLDSPPITLPATTPALTFWHRYSAESPTGTFPTGYNGWDGMNLRISTNGGATWVIVPAATMSPTTARYNKTSLYSFGFQHGEGTGIPGWCGRNATWSQVTADLSTWANQTVKLRWAFASDPEFCTQDSAAMFGWEIDNIRVYQTSATDTVFSDDANVATGWTPSDHAAGGGNLWRITTDDSRPLGDQHVLACNNAGTNLYNPNMDTYIESPYVDCRSLGAGSLILDFAFAGSFGCPTTGDCGDYFGVMVSADSGVNWCYASNPTCITPAPCTDQVPVCNYIYTIFPDTWTNFDEFYTDPLDMGLVNGHVLKFRLIMASDGNAVTDPGLMVDSFKVVFTPDMPNDIRCTTLQVRYPNKEGLPFLMKAYYANVGANTETGIAASWRTLPQTVYHPFPGANFTLAPGESVTKDTMLTITYGDSLFSFMAKSVLANDDNLANDTASARSVYVAPNNDNTLEMGYDSRTIRYLFKYPHGSGPMMHFTARADNVAPGMSTYNLDYIATIFDQSQTRDVDVNVHIYLGGTSTPGATQIYNQTITVTAAETGNWSLIDLRDVAGTRGMADDFWVWFETTTNDSFPRMLGDLSQPWSDIHNYQYNGTTATVSPFFHYIHAIIEPTGDAVDHNNTTVLPEAWSLQQNYPNPFNPTTEIRFSVPKAEQMTLKVFNVLGQQVAALVDGVAQPGIHTVSFDGSNLASGVYVCRLESKSFTATQKMLLMK